MYGEKRKEIVTIIGYLIGVKDEILEKNYETDTLEKLKISKEATITRCLCKLRTTLMYKFKATETEMRYNLKNIDLTVPRDKLVVFTGLSGSGKSSLAFDTIYAEGQRRYDHGRLQVVLFHRPEQQSAENHFLQKANAKGG